MADPKPSAEARCAAVAYRLHCAQDDDTLARTLDAFAALRVAEAVAAEREACAVLVEDFDVVQHGGYYGGDDGGRTLGAAARAIRARAKGAGNGSV